MNMISAISLPLDTSGYGDVAYKYIGLNLVIQFHYSLPSGEDRVGEILFTVCTFLKMNGTLTGYDEIGYDTIYQVESGIGLDNSQSRYKFMLSGSDFQFDIVAQAVKFTPESDRLISLL